jgi:hypothetical protein
MGVISFVIVDDTPVIVRFGVIGVKPDSLSVVRYGPVIVPFVAVGAAPVIVRTGVFGVEPDSLVVVRYGPVIVLLAITVDNAPVKVR